MHNFWLTVGLVSLILWAGVLPAVTGLWPWFLFAALFSLTPLTYVGGLQIVLLIVSFIAIPAGLM